ncbi:MAG: hypothetical protein QG578_1088 [Thermodesulfobacteriota bacterium]|nr:hypothetical protein [Thermodesulfobacteriota bacterium]
MTGKSGNDGKKAGMTSIINIMMKEPIAKLPYSYVLSFPRKRESNVINRFWNPTFVGVTIFGTSAIGSKDKKHDTFF